MLMFSLLCFLLWFRLCSFVVFARFGGAFSLTFSRPGMVVMLILYYAFFLCWFCLFWRFWGLNYVLYCFVFLGMSVFALCSLFAVPFGFFLTPLFVWFCGGFCLGNISPVRTSDSTNRPCPSSTNLVFWLSFDCSGVHARLTTAIRGSFCPLPVRQTTITSPYTHTHPCMPTMVMYGHP